MQSHKPGYKEALAACKHFGKKWDELTELERKWEKIAGKKPAPRTKGKTDKKMSVKASRIDKPPSDIKIPQDNRDDLFFLADALKMAADEMRALNGTLRELIAEAEREKRS